MHSLRAAIPSTTDGCNLPEGDLMEAAEQLSNGIVTQLEYAIGELW
jgi:hypothetical protein